MSTTHEVHHKVVKPVSNTSVTVREVSARCVRADSAPTTVKAETAVKATNTKIKGLDVDTSRFIWHETPSIDGTRKILTTANEYTSGLIEVFRDGILQQKTTDYAETDSTTVTLATALDADEQVWVHYIKAV